LEHGKRGHAFATGLAAISTIFSLFNSGDHFVVSRVVYGGTYRLLTQILNRVNMSASFVDTTDLAAVEAAITPKTKAIYVETVTNPTMEVSDIQALASLAKSTGLKLIVDNTFLTPYYQNALLLGADIVVHSATKYLGGHSDLMAGLIVTNSDELGEEFHFSQKAIGAVLSPFDSWLLMRGMKTLSVRMDKHESNARALAEWLTTLPQIKKVNYPGLPDHPQHELAKRQQRGFGGMISFEVATPDVAEAFLKRLKLIGPAISLGGVESLMCLPAKRTHASFPPEERAKLGISDSLLRFSVGIENVEDLKQDVLQALEAE
jgi:cystathionine beta-lyase/cystathionine gamma-synthase